jgi:hypothetical protein
MNRTSEGLQRRQRLEEAIVAGHAISAGRPSHAADTMPSSSITSATAVSDAGYLDITSDRSLLDHFMRLYLPTAPENRTGATLNWLKEAYECLQPSLVLELARHALSANRVAVVGGNSPMKHTGHIYYGRALQALNERLSNQLENCDNQVLAAARCLMIYEIFESTAASVTSWASHQRGLVGLVIKRGVANFQDDTSKALLLDIRGTDVSMYKSLHTT